MENVNLPLISQRGGFPRGQPYLPMIYILGLIVRLKSSLAVDSPMPPVPPTKMPTKSLMRWPCALLARTDSLETICNGSLLKSREVTASRVGLTLRRSPAPSQVDVGGMEARPLTAKATGRRRWKAWKDLEMIWRVEVICCNGRMHRASAGQTDRDGDGRCSRLML